MSLNALLNVAAILPVLKVSTKKQSLQELSNRASALSGISAQEIFDSVLQRERLGSTGVGGGVAIPHIKLLRCQEIFGVFARLIKPVNFEAIDDLPVDLIFFLIAPESAGADHLKALAKIARVLRNSETRFKLRETSDAPTLFSLLLEAEVLSQTIPQPN